MSRTNAVNATRSGSSTRPIESSTGNSSPFLRSARVSTRVPSSFASPVRRYRANPSRWSTRSGSGTMTSTIMRPSTSARAYPKVRSAAGLNSTMRPDSSIATIPSSAVSSIADRRASLARTARSARRRRTNDPTWAPTAAIMSSISSSGSATFAPKNSITPRNSSPLTSGHASAHPNPACVRERLPAGSSRRRRRRAPKWLPCPPTRVPEDRHPTRTRSHDSVRRNRRMIRCSPRTRCRRSCCPAVSGSHKPPQRKLSASHRTASTS